MIGWLASWLTGWLDDGRLRMLYLGPSWVQLAAILSQLKAIEGHLGAMFHSSSAILQLLAAKMRPESEKNQKQQQQQQQLQ